MTYLKSQRALYGPLRGSEILFNILGRLGLLSRYDQRAYDQIRKAKARARVRNELRRLG